MPSDRRYEAEDTEPAKVLSSEEIRDRAYDIWDRHYRPEGYDLQFWFMAERELPAERRASQAGKQVEMS